MTIGRTDDPENPFCAAAFEAASLLGTGSRIPSGPADMAPRREGRTHDRNRPACQTSHFSLASERPSTHGTEDGASANHVGAVGGDFVVLDALHSSDKIQE